MEEKQTIDATLGWSEDKFAAIVDLHKLINTL